MNEDLYRIIDKLKMLEKDIKKKYKAEIVGFFGSYARGEQERKSDLDVLVNFHEGATLIEFVGLAQYLEETLGIDSVDVVPCDLVRPELKERIFQDTVYI